MRISDWSSDVCSSDLRRRLLDRLAAGRDAAAVRRAAAVAAAGRRSACAPGSVARHDFLSVGAGGDAQAQHVHAGVRMRGLRSEEHTSELQSLMRISYADFCLKKKQQSASEKQRPNNPT